jgi:hypothetical protein
MEKTIDTFDLEVVMDLVIGILERHDVAEVLVRYFDLGEDEELSKKVAVDQLKDLFLEFYEYGEDHYYWGFFVGRISFGMEFDAGRLCFTYSEDLKEECNVFADDL